MTVTGSVMKEFVNHRTENEIRNLIKNTIVFARVSPSQKEYIVQILRACGEKVLMCGDGTNDVGALKKSEVGKEYTSFRFFFFKKFKL